MIVEKHVYCVSQPDSDETKHLFTKGVQIVSQENPKLNVHPVAQSEVARTHRWPARV